MVTQIRKVGIMEVLELQEQETFGNALSLSRSFGSGCA